MSDIYLCDRAPSKRTLSKMEETLSDIMMTSKPNATRIVHTKKGFILNFPHESDANIFFDKSFYPKLKSAKLEPSFTKASEVHRLVYIRDIPYETYLNDEDTLCYIH